MGLLKLAINRQTRELVNFNGSVTSLPPLSQTNSQDFQITIVDPTGDPLTPYAAVDCSASELRVVLATKATGTLGDGAANLLASTYEAGWGWDNDLQAFLGTLNQNTNEVAEYIGVLAFKAAILEINLIKDGVAQTVYGHRNGAANVILGANCDEGQAEAPSVLTAPPTIISKVIQNGVGGVVVVDNLVTVTGLGLGSSPSYWLPYIEAPAGSGFIGCNYVHGSGSTDGFSVILSAVPPNNNYRVTAIPAP